MARTPPLILACTVALVALTPLTPEAAAQEDSHALWGIVCPAADSQGGDICWSPGMGATTLTLSASGSLDLLEEDETFENERDGTFNAGGLEDGEYTLSASRTGFEDWSTTFTVAGEDVKLDVVMVGQTVTVDGVVSSAEGPVPGAAISFYGPQEESTQSDDAGHFSASLQAGHYEYQVSADGYRTLHGHGLLDGQQDFAFEMDAGPQRSVTLRGTVTNSEDEPVSGAAVRATQWPEDCCYDEPMEAGSDDDGQDVAYSSRYYGHETTTATTAADGSYEMQVFAGWVDLYFSAEGHRDRYDGFHAEDGQSYTKDATLVVVPAKNATLSGVIRTGDGDTVPYVTLSLQYPEYGIHECSTQSGGDGSTGGGSSGSSSGSGDSTDPASSPAIMPMPDERWEQECAIQISSDGTFTAQVAPGYAILRAYHDHWRSCEETHNSDGSSSSSCGPEYRSYVQTLVIEDDGENRVTVTMDQKPAPDAIISGYVIDGDAQTSIPGARISFSHQDHYGHGWAQTDGDGSYRVRLQSGSHEVSVWADGYLQWQGIVQVASGGETPLDVMMRAGESDHGCCYYYGDGVAVAEESAMDSAGAPSRASGTDDVDDGALSSGESTSASGAGGEAQGFEDLGGGLGPYDPDAREQATQDNTVPGPAWLVLAIGLVAAAAMVRRRGV